MRDGQLTTAAIGTTSGAVGAVLILALLLAPVAGFAQDEPSPPPSPTASKQDKSAWRHDPTLRRRPGSYLGGGLDYTLIHVWVEETDDLNELEFGPLHTWGMSFRVGDAFADWFSLGFQILMSSINRDKQQVSMFGLMLDSSFYPWRGLGIRPAVGIGMGFAQGENSWELGSGGPGCLSLSLLYEFRVGRYFTIAPVAQTVWIVSDGYDGLYLFLGLEFTKWFKTATS